MQLNYINGVTRLSHWGVIRAQGEDVANFLHNQLSQDVQTLDATHARLAAYCTAKGRMLASMLILRPKETEVWLLCRADVLAATLKRLTMFVLRAKVKLTDATTELPVLGYAGPSAVQALGLTPEARAAAGVWDVRQVDDGLAVQLPSAFPVGDSADLQRWLWVGDAAHAAARLQVSPALSLDLWRWLEVKSGIAMISQPVVEQFVPQMVNFELVGGVNFKKGCYPGQEIVARSQYLGKLKRRMVLLEGSSSAQAGQEVYSNGDSAQPAGMVVDAAPHPEGGYSALVEVKLAALDAGDLHLGTADGPLLKLAPLPYSLPAEDRA